MQYRMDKNGNALSVLGFGMMRLKRRQDDTLDEQWAINTLRYAIDQGLNYVDTAYAYGDSERVTGLCLQDGYREKVTLASKLPVRMMTCAEDFDRILNEQLQRLQTDHIDYYLLHALNRETWEREVKQYRVLEQAEKAKQEGKINYIGFSFHDNLDAFRQILNGYDQWDFCQIQLNYMDVDYQAGITGLKEAHEKGLAVIIMEPLRGGTLANVPSEVARLLPTEPVGSALNFLWNMPEVTVVLSGMSEFDQVEQNLAYAHKAQAGMLSQQQVQQTVAAGEAMRRSLSIPCTGCNYCNVCPQQIPIPELFALENQRMADGDNAGARQRYAQLGEKVAERCVGCGACVKQCPQTIDIPQKLAKLCSIYK